MLERHRARMKDADAQMRRRAELAEHPFGTLKCRAGYRHFLVRGFNKVRGEWSLMALCYNFSRVLNIVCLDSLIAYLAKQAGNSSFLRIQRALAAAIGSARTLPERIWAAMSTSSKFTGGRLNLAA